MNSYSEGNEWLLNVLLKLNRKLILHPSCVTPCTHLTFDPSEVKIYQNFNTASWVVSKGSAAVIDAENWANCPFKRKLYYGFMNVNWSIR